MMQHPCAATDGPNVPPDMTRALAHLEPRGRRNASPRGRSHAGKQDENRGAASNRVLLFGSIRELALYRAEFLRHSGFHVLTPRNVGEAISMIEDGEYDAAILTYTLPDEIVQELAELLRQVCPDCPLITISQTGHHDRRIHPEEVVLADDGPNALLEALRRSLHKPTH